MFNYMILKRSIIIALSAAMCTSTGIAHAFDMCKNMFGKMNQSEWRGDHRGRDYGYAPSGYGYGR